MKSHLILSQLKSTLDDKFYDEDHNYIKLSSREEYTVPPSSSWTFDQTGHSSGDNDVWTCSVVHGLSVNDMIIFRTSGGGAARICRRSHLLLCNAAVP